MRAWIEIFILAHKKRRISSLSSGERGLKYCDTCQLALCLLSLSSGERGLKYILDDTLQDISLSLSSGERGLKFFSLIGDNCSNLVALFRRAWIEMII